MTIKLRNGLEVTGGYHNFCKVFAEARQHEIDDGYRYYENLSWKIRRRVLHSIPLITERASIAAFAALSPNNSEAMNLLALDICIAIVKGELPKDMRVPSYRKNTAKALTILSDDNPSILRGPKVTAFYNSILNPDGNHITIDGHMFNAWCGTPRPLKSVAYLTPSHHATISSDLLSAANMYNIPATRFQAIVWLAWKRIHRIVYNPQRSFDFDPAP